MTKLPQFNHIDNAPSLRPCARQVTLTPNLKYVPKLSNMYLHKVAVRIK